jgi:hypothetical protein
MEKERLVNVVRLPHLVDEIIIDPEDRTVGFVPWAKMGALVGRPTPIGLPGYRDYIKGGSSMEYLSELTPPFGLDLYMRMRTTDPIVGGLMMQYENIIRKMQWDVVGPNSTFVKNQLLDMQTPLIDILYEAASALTFGFYIGELLWGVKGGSVALYDIEPRYQTSIDYINDENGNVVQEVTQLKVGGANINIPYAKCWHHKFFSYARNPWGTSLLRHIYKPYYFKLSIEASEAVGLDRDLTGLPIMTAPEGFDFQAADPGSPNYSPAVEQTLNWAIDIVSNVRKDNMQGVVKPSGWTFDIVRGENRTVVPTNEIIARYNTEMAAGLLENFLSLGAFATTNNANTQMHITNFLSACEALATAAASTFTQQVIHKICDYNGKKSYPRLVGRIVNMGELTNISRFLSDLTKAGVINPNKTLEAAMLQLANLPANDNDVGWDEGGGPKKVAIPKVPVQTDTTGQV